MNTKNNFIVDGETLLHRWVAIEDFKDTNIFVSSSNYTQSKKLLAKSLELLKPYPEKLKEFTEAHKEIISILSDKNITNDYIEFIGNTEAYMTPISMIPLDRNLNIIIFKGVELEKEKGDVVHPTIDETVAFGQYQMHNGNRFTIYTMNDSIINFCLEFQFNIDIIDVRL